MPDRYYSNDDTIDTSEEPGGKPGSKPGGTTDGAVPLMHHPADAGSHCMPFPDLLI
jgi:hypothetical protein